jgi:DNA modification methylase
MTNQCTARIILGDARCMAEVDDESVHLAVTSPPYWQIKDYGSTDQIGYGQSLHNYLFDLSRVWRECWRVLQPGRRLCINIGDQFARSTVYGRYQVIPLHAEIIAQCAAVGFDYLGAIIWKKTTTIQTTGGATVMGSFPHPPNGIVELDYEYILLFKKPGLAQPIPRSVKDESRLTKEEWKEYFSGHWVFGGARQKGHGAMFPPELPRRLIRMFSFAGDTVLDPFLGSGTTAQAALELGRSAVGYEVQQEFAPLVRERLKACSIEKRRCAHFPVDTPLGYIPHVADAAPTGDFPEAGTVSKVIRKVTEITGPASMRLEDATHISLLGISVRRQQQTAATEYLERFVLGKKIRVQPEKDHDGSSAYLYLSNGLFIYRKMIEMGLAGCDGRCRHRLNAKFRRAEEKYRRTLEQQLDA